MKNNLTDVFVIRVQAAIGFIIILTVATLIFCSTDAGKVLIGKILKQDKPEPTPAPRGYVPLGPPETREIMGTYDESSSHKTYTMTGAGDRVLMFEKDENSGKMIKVGEGKRDGAFIVIKFFSTLAEKNGNFPEGLLELTINPNTSTLTGVFKQNGQILQHVTLQLVAMG